MKKFFALLLVLTICALCFFVSCTNQDNNGNDNQQSGENSGENDSGEGSIPDITDDENNGILNEDNIDPNGWTTID